MLIHATRQPLADSRIRLRSCNGGRHITCSDSKMKVERKAKQNINDCNAFGKPRPIRSSSRLGRVT